MRLCRNADCREEVTPVSRCEADGHAGHHSWCCEALRQALARQVVTLPPGSDEDSAREA